MMSDEFIEGIITPEYECTDATMIYRQFNGLESVVRYDEYDTDMDGGDNNE